MADSVKKAVYELLAASIIKENHLNKSDPDIKQKIDKLGIDDSVKKAVYGILRFS